MILGGLNPFERLVISQLLVKIKQVYTLENYPPWLLPWHSYIPFYREVVATECISTSFLLQNVKSNLSIEWFPGTL